MGSIQSHEVLELHSEEIEKAIQSDLSQVVDDLVNGYDDEQIRSQIFDDPAIASDAVGKARKLLTIVKGKVEQNPAHFDKFTGVLKKSNDQQQIQLAEKLEKARDCELVMSRKSLIRTSLHFIESSLN